ncbi:cytochrome-c peroxidase [Polyangium spumosum]|uniref:Methylamine utilization protein n=1 Tax=Polyangium spumosum TaxID=889282 RepID=A0A6N7PYI2_9BACT|nr:cytochrome c peroxidase [Polyangium spumosum]MRG96627.1 methylamine utilization protein [Polyangium spumosum]
MMRLTRVALLVAMLALQAGCGERAPPTPPFTPQELAYLEGMSPLGPLPPSHGNTFADDPRAAALGRRLFFDAGLSATGRVSCASCHDPARYFTDGRPRAVGRGEGPRNTPSLLVAPHYPFLAWDGRKDSVWSQALGALLDEREHAISVDAAARRVKEVHGEAYEVAFGPLPDLADPAARERVFVHAGKAIEAYLRDVARLEPSPFDHYVAALLAGDPSGGGHLSAPAVRGLRVFLGEARCVACHHGPLLSDREFHAIGLPPAFGAPARDEGRARGITRLDADPYRCGARWSDTSDCPSLRFLDRRSPDHVAAFRTPSLRNVERTGPYMHGGQIGSLEDVVDHYRVLSHEPRVGRRDVLLLPLPRAVRTDDLVAFLRSLTSPPPPGSAPGFSP